VIYIIEPVPLHKLTFSLSTFKKKLLLHYVRRYATASSSSTLQISG
jgi:hypothetical protein